MIRLFRSAVAGFVFALAGCSGGSDQATSRGALIERAYQTLASQYIGEPAALPSLTPQLIDGLKTPLLELTVEEREATAYLTPRYDQTDSRPGSLRTWRTVDDTFITLRQGVLVTTRGVGDDIQSTDASAAVAAVRGARPVSGPQTVFFANPVWGTSRIDLNCQMTSLGATRIEIVQRGFDAVHLRQTCTGAEIPVTNDFWVDRSGGTVWQSRQWGGPGMGYVRIRLLKK